MAEKIEKKKKSNGSKEPKDKSAKKDKKEKKSSKANATTAETAASTSFSLLANEQNVDPGLSSLFAVKQPAVKANNAPIREYPAEKKSRAKQTANDDDLSSIDEEFDDEDEASEAEEEVPNYDERLPRPDELLAEIDGGEDAEKRSKRKRKRKDGDDLEDKYLTKVAREEEKDAAKLAAERASKRQKAVEEDESDAEAEATSEAEDEDVDMEDNTDDANSEVDIDDNDDEDLSPPKHETQTAADEELAKASRTVFLGNVSTLAIKSKSSKKELISHLGSFFSKLPTPKDNTTKHKVESIRFRSTPYASAIPKKAAFAKQELMDATTRSTNAYAVYSSPSLALAAVKHLNGSMILDRHLRVDSVAHPSPVDNRRCVFVGNLGFVDDETNIQDANEEEGREKRKRGKEPADIEEGLWRTFARCGKVESVRVIRDSTTRVGKGIAYVQFDDANGVEAALLLNEKKFPPMLPRKLRVSRAKAPKRNVKPGSGRPSARAKPTSGYQRKISAAEQSQLGRAGKLLGRAGAAQRRRPEQSAGGKPSAKKENGESQIGEGIRRPESFIFEGHRASSKQGTSGLKLGGKKGGGGGGGGGAGKKTKVTKRSASFRAKKRAA